MAISFEILDLTQKESRERVGRFFRRETDKMGEEHMLFDVDRWGQCNEAIVAEDGSDIVGIVTLAHRGIDNFRSPMVDTVYVPKMRRGKGLGTSLFEQGIRRLLSATGEGTIFCDVASSIVARIIERLPEDLRNHLSIRPSFRNTDLVKDFEELERDFPG